MTEQEALTSFSSTRLSSSFGHFNSSFAINGESLDKPTHTLAREAERERENCAKLRDTTHLALIAAASISLSYLLDPHQRGLSKAQV